MAAFDADPPQVGTGDIVFYGGTDVALTVAKRYRLALLEPPFDLLARLPFEFVGRRVEHCRFDELGRLRASSFVKPADPADKFFDAGVYRDVSTLRASRPVDPGAPVLVAEPVEWLAEYRCFILEGKVAAVSPYLSFGCPNWRPFRQGGADARPPREVLAFCDRFFSVASLPLPPAFVMDVGLVEDGGWNVVEFNPAWCSSLLGADPRAVIPVLARASRQQDRAGRADQRWVIPR